MSANNQILIKKYKGRWYVFDTPAESWEDAAGKVNHLSLKTALGGYASAEEALDYGLDVSGETEYGVANRLVKDGADVTIVDTEAWIKKHRKALERLAKL
jgi:hypothetical protein